jgi:uncharacterized protein YjdB
VNRRSCRRYIARAVVIVGVVLVGACPRGVTEPSYELRVSPASANLFVEDSTRLTASLVDDGGSPVDAPLLWSTDNPSVATVDSTGMVRAVGAGTTLVRVTARGQEATASIAVAEDNGQTLTMTPSAASLFVDGTQRFRAVLKNRHGDTIPAEPAWESSNPAVATVNPSGLVRAIATGSATIQATVNQLVASGAVTVNAQPPSVTFVGAGDIASCSSGSDEATARLLDDIPGTVFTVGDNAYPNGTATDYANCYAPSWGRHKARTRPVAGNHEYDIPNATGYFAYFGAAAGDPTKGYYSYDLGGWHIIALNSNLRADAGSPQEQWLRADLASNGHRCTLAYWHHPRFSSGSQHGNTASMQALWQALYEYDADVVISAHEHTYERFAPQTASGELDLSKGIREFLVGTGGASLYTFGAPKPNSEVRYSSTRGVLKLMLSANLYSWQFIPTSGSFTDTGSASCH